MSAKPIRPSLTRRALIAATAGLALANARGNRAGAQSAGLPPAAEALTRIMPQSPPPLTFTTAAGTQRTLADYPGYGLVVNIWATWCGPCVAELPSLAAAAPRLRAAGILILPIAIDIAGLPTVKSFFLNHHITTLPILLDPSGATAAALGATGIPATIIIDTTGNLVAHLEGAADWNAPGTLGTLKSLTNAKRPHDDVQPVRVFEG